MQPARSRKLWLSGTMNRAANVALALTLTGVCLCAHGPERYPTVRQARQGASASLGSVTMRDYGVLGDGSDETARMQAAVATAAAAGKALYWNAGNYVVSAAIPIFADSKFVTDCATCVSITNRNDGVWTLEYDSLVAAVSYPQRVGIEIDGLTINAKFGIKINYAWDQYGGTPSFDSQAWCWAFASRISFSMGPIPAPSIPNAARAPCPLLPI